MNRGDSDEENLPVGHVVQGHDLTRLHFTVTCTTQIGQQVFVLGDANAMGCFDRRRGIELVTSPSEFPRWSTAHDLLVPTGVPVVFKCALYSGGEFREWEGVDGQRVVTPHGRRMHVDIVFGEDAVYAPDPRVGPGTDGRAGRIPASASAAKGVPLASRVAGGAGGRAQRTTVERTTIFGGDDAVRDLIDADTLLAEEGREIACSLSGRRPDGRRGGSRRSGRLMLVSAFLPVDVVLLRRDGESAATPRRGRWRVRWQRGHIVARNEKRASSMHCEFGNPAGQTRGGPERSPVGPRRGTRAAPGRPGGRTDEAPAAGPSPPRTAGGANGPWTLSGSVADEVETLWVGAASARLVRVFVADPGQTGAGDWAPGPSAAADPPARAAGPPEGSSRLSAGSTRGDPHPSGPAPGPPAAERPRRASPPPRLAGTFCPLADAEDEAALSAEDRAEISALLRRMQCEPIWIEDALRSAAGRPTGSGGGTDGDAEALDAEERDAEALDAEALDAEALDAEELFYGGFCQQVLWPALHNVLRLFGPHWDPGQGFDAPRLERWWRAYSAVNAVFADTLLGLLRTAADVVWVHDYELCLVPLMLRERARALADGRFRAGKPLPAVVFYFHTAFPTSEIFRSLERRYELLRGVLGADLVGFHSFGYARHFMNTCKRLLGIRCHSRRGGRLVIQHGGTDPATGASRDARSIGITIAHVGVDLGLVAWRLSHPHVRAAAAALRRRHRGRQIIASVDDCQRLRGVPLKLLAFHSLLQDCPGLRETCVLVQRCDRPRLEGAGEGAGEGTERAGGAEGLEGRSGGRSARGPGDAAGAGTPVPPGTDAARPGLQAPRFARAKAGYSGRGRDTRQTASELRQLAEWIERCFGPDVLDLGLDAHIPGGPPGARGGSAGARRSAPHGPSFSLDMDARLALWAAADVFFSTPVCAEPLNLYPLEFMAVHACLREEARARRAEDAREARSSRRGDLSAEHSRRPASVSAPPSPRLRCVSTPGEGGRNNAGMGAAVLSEFSASSEVINGARFVNPYNVPEVADALFEALSKSAKRATSDGERDHGGVWTGRQRTARARGRGGNSASAWSKHVLSDLLALDGSAGTTFDFDHAGAANDERRSPSGSSEATDRSQPLPAGTRPRASRPRRAGRRGRSNSLGGAAAAASTVSDPADGRATAAAGSGSVGARGRGSLSLDRDPPGAEKNSGSPGHGPAKSEILVSRSVGATSGGSAQEELEVEMERRRAGGAMHTMVAEPAELDAIVGAYARSRRRLILLDYGGTLVEREGAQQYAKRQFTGTSSRAPEPTTLRALHEIARDPRNECYVVSGARRETLERMLEPTRPPSRERGASSVGAETLPRGPRRSPRSRAARAEAGTNARAPPGAATEAQDGRVRWLAPRLGLIASGGQSVSRPGLRAAEGGRAPLPAVASKTAVGSGPDGSAPPGSAPPGSTASGPRRWEEQEAYAQLEGGREAWQRMALETMERFTWRVNGATVSQQGEGGHALVWDWRRADPEWGAAQGQALADALERRFSETAGLDVQVVRLQGQILVQPQRLGKGMAVKRLLRSYAEQEAAAAAAGGAVAAGSRGSGEPPAPAGSRGGGAAAATKGAFDFVLCVGDDDADEGMFEALYAYVSGDRGGDGGAGAMHPAPCIVEDAHLFTCTVGNKSTSASLYLRGPAHVQTLLSRMAASSEDAEGRVRTE